MNLKTMEIAITIRKKPMKLKQMDKFLLKMRNS